MSRSSDTDSPACTKRVANTVITRPPDSRIGAPSNSTVTDPRSRNSTMER